MKSSVDGALTPCLFYRRNSNTKSLKARKTVYDRKFPAEPSGCYDNLCLHRLRKRGRIHLSSGGADVGRTGQGTETCMDRLPDGGRNLTWNPGGKRSLSLRQSGKCCLSAGQGRLSHGYQFSRALTLKYGNTVKGYLKRDRAVISVGRVMTCVLGMIVNREREIRSFTKTPFYRVIGNFKLQEKPFTAEWRAVEGSKYYNSPALYKENGFKKKRMPSV